MSSKQLRRPLRTSMFAVCAILLGVTAGCGGSAVSTDPASSVSGSSSAPTSSTPASTSKSSALSIAGSPSTQAEVGQPYSFTPTVQNPTGEAVAFSVQNKPDWATFSIADGSISGTPSGSDVGTDSNIGITASAGQQTVALAPFSISVASSNAGGGANGASLVFSYPSGFPAAAQSKLFLNNSAVFNGSAIDVTSGTYGVHEAGAAWYTTQQDITSFTTDFTFQITPGGYGFTFIIQNDPRGVNTSADANGIGYFVYSGSPNLLVKPSIGITFNATPNSNAYTVEANPSMTGLYIDGGPFIDNGISPVVDLTPQNVDLQSGHVMDAHITYDGTILTMVLSDTSTGAQARLSWPVDIPAIIGGNSAYIGFGGGTIPAVAQAIDSWSWWQGIGSRLASPTFSVSGGEYTTSQTVSISGPTGASIYFTTDGKPPTTASTPYTGPITVSSSEYVQAIAVESGYTDSLVAGASYSIGGSGTPPVNFPNGFANAGALFSTVGTATINGSALQLTDSTQTSEIGAAWYVAPVNIQSFTASFTMKFVSASGYGMAFVIQNQNGSSTDTSSQQVSGGPYNLGLPISGLGYQGTLASIAVKFDSLTSPGNTTGLYEDGAAPTTGQTPITGIQLGSGDPINVTLTYNGTTLAMSMKDTVTGATFATSWTVNIPALVGGDTAYIGFTGSTDYNLNTTHQVTALTFNN